MPTMKKASLKALIQKEIEAQIVENIDNEVVRKTKVNSGKEDDWKNNNKSRIHL